MMAKIIVSSLTLQIWLESFSECEELEFRVKNGQLICDNSFLNVETKGEGSVTLTWERIKDFIAVLCHLKDQPIVLVFESGRLWLWQALI